MADNKYDDSLFLDDKHPDNADDDELFLDEPHPEFKYRTLASVAEEQNPPQDIPDVSASRAALVGAGQGATFGFGEEITAPFVAAAGMAQSGLDKTFGDGSEALPTLPGEDTWAKYQRLMQEYRDVARAEQQGAQEQQPGAYTAGAVAGGLAAPGLGAAKAMGAVGKAVPGFMGLPIRAAAGAGMGYGMGGLAGAGEVEGSLEERLPAAHETAKMGAGIGAVIPVAGQIASFIGKGVGKIAELPLISKSVEAYQRGARRQNLITKAGLEEANQVGRNLGGDLAEDIKSLKDDVGRRIGSKIDEAEASGEKVDLNEEIPAVLEKLKVIKAEGSEEAAKYANSIEKEIKKILKIKSQEDGYLGVADDALPEGLIKPKQAPPSYEVSPKQAQDLKQVLGGYSSKPGIDPQRIEGAKIAKDLKGNVGKKLDEVSGVNTPETEGGLALNEQYGKVKDILKDRLKLKPTDSPEAVKDKMFNLVNQLESNSNAIPKAKVNHILNELREVAPELADKYANKLNDASGRIQLANEINKGFGSWGLLGTIQGGIKGSANVIGRVSGKLGIDTVGKAGANFTKAVLGSNAAKTGVIKHQTQGAGALENVSQKMEPYKLQRQVASAAENAEPELLKEQAEEIRKKHGNQGAQLATILDNMADQGKDSRRALMFTVLQNQAYRKMLGLTQDEDEAQ